MPETFKGKIENVYTAKDYGMSNKIGNNIWSSPEGSIAYCDDKGYLHRDDDLPAVIWFTGCKGWFQHGKCHRDGDLPAFIFDNGKTKEWYKDGRQHRDNDMPAYIDDEGKQEWWHDGLIYKKGIKNNQGEFTEQELTLETRYIRSSAYKIKPSKWRINGNSHRFTDEAEIISSIGDQYYLKDEFYIKDISVDGQ